MVVFLLAIALAVLTGWFVQVVASGAIDRAVSAFRELIGGWRMDPWPRGVQEEDRDKPWAAGTAAPPTAPFGQLIEPTASAVTTSHVRGRTRSL